MPRSQKMHTQDLPHRIRYARAYSNARDGDETYTAEETEFLRAIASFKQLHQIHRLTPRQVLDVIHALGYRRAAG